MYGKIRGKKPTGVQKNNPLSQNLIRISSSQKIAKILIVFGLSLSQFKFELGCGRLEKEWIKNTK